MSGVYVLHIAWLQPGDPFALDYGTNAPTMDSKKVCIYVCTCVRVCMYIHKYMSMMCVCMHFLEYIYYVYAASLSLFIYGIHDDILLYYIFAYMLCISIHTYMLYIDNE